MVKNLTLIKPYQKLYHMGSPSATIEACWKNAGKKVVNVTKRW